MSETHPSTLSEITCPVCGNQRSPLEMRPGMSLSENLKRNIEHNHPDWNSEMEVCEYCMRNASANVAQELLIDENGELTDLEREVIDSFRDGEVMPMNSHDEDIRERTRGEIYADRVTDIVGSWKFTFTLITFLVVWIGFGIASELIVVNTVLVLGVISATLGTVAAIQGPIILMSQRRSAKRDRLRAENDFRVNLKAELEIQALNHKLDHIVSLQLDNIRRIEQLETDTMRRQQD